MKAELAATLASLCSSETLVLHGYKSRREGVRKLFFEEIKRLKKKQEHLKDELYSAKSRINSDPDRWSYELHTEASGLDHTDPNFVEAFEKETVILDKRVQACKSHVVFSTSFMNRKSSEDRKRLGAEYNRSQGCTADCEPYGQPGPELASTARSQSTGQL